MMIKSLNHIFGGKNPLPGRRKGEKKRSEGENDKAGAKGRGKLAESEGEVKVEGGTDAPARRQHGIKMIPSKAKGSERGFPFSRIWKFLIDWWSLR